MMRHLLIQKQEEQQQRKSRQHLIALKSILQFIHPFFSAEDHYVKDRLETRLLIEVLDTRSVDFILKLHFYFTDNPFEVLE